MAIKKGFILYNDQKEVIDELSNEEAGTLLKTMYDYNVNGKFELKGTLKIIFLPFKTSFDRDNERYDETCKKNKNNIKKYWEKVKKEDTNEYDRIRMNTMATNIDSDSDIDRDKDIGSDSDINTLCMPPTTHDTIFSFIKPLFEKYDEDSLEKSCKKFFDFYNDKKWKGVKDWQSKAKFWISNDIEDGKIKIKKVGSRRLE